MLSTLLTPVSVSVSVLPAVSPETDAVPEKLPPPNETVDSATGAPPLRATVKLPAFNGLQLTRPVTRSPVQVGAPPCTPSSPTSEIVVRLAVFPTSSNCAVVSDAWTCFPSVTAGLGLKVHAPERPVALVACATPSIE